MVGITFSAPLLDPSLIFFIFTVVTRNGLAKGPAVTNVRTSAQAIMKDRVSPDDSKVDSRSSDIEKFEDPAGDRFGNHTSLHE